MYGVYDGHHTYDEGQGLILTPSEFIVMYAELCSLAKADCDVMW